MSNTESVGDNRYWILVGATPTGPFAMQQLRMKLVSGEIKEDTQVCPAGGTSWVPLAAVSCLGAGLAVLADVVQPAGPIAAQALPQAIPIAVPVQQSLLGCPVSSQPVPAIPLAVPVQQSSMEGAETAQAPLAIPLATPVDATPAEQTATPDENENAEELLEAVESVLPENTKQHLQEIKEHAFLVFLIAVASFASVPTLLGHLFLTPRGEIGQLITIWNVIAATAPLTIATAIDVAVLLYLLNHPEQQPKTQHDKNVLACILAGVIVGSVLIGYWFGAVTIPKPAAEAMKSISETAPRGLALTLARSGQRNPKAAAAWAAATLGAGALAGLVNYFTMYGPLLFFNSLVVGAFLGWILAIKVPVVVGVGPITEAAPAEQRRAWLIACAATAVLIALALLYRWGGMKTILCGAFGIAAGAASVGILIESRRELTKGEEPEKGAWIGTAIAGIASIVLLYLAYAAHYDIRYEYRVQRAPTSKLRQRPWSVVKDQADAVFFRNDSVKALTNVKIQFEAKPSRFSLNLRGWKPWNTQLIADRIEPGESVFWLIDIEAGESATYSVTVACDQR